MAHVELIPARDPAFADLDPPLSPRLAESLAERGVHRLYRHQAGAIALVRGSTHTVVAAGTASGKSLCYQIPLAEAVLADRRATALLIFPTKALTRDQFASLYRLGLKELVPAVYDGDTEPEDRAWVRRHANAVLTNPDMLHVGILPGHARWARFLSRLRLVVVDELHTYRGIFGSHVALVLRRLRRLAAHYGARPTFVFSSATIGNPGELASRLTGLPVEVVDQDASPAGAKQVVVWNPPLDDPDSGERRSPLAEATDLLVDLVRRGRHTIAFTRSRKGVELVYRWARDRLEPDVAERIAPYRAGYLAEERRRVEQRLFSGELLGVTATNALELGIDVGSLDAAVITTFPGTIASFRQQAGRAGRTREESLAVLVAGEDALDQYYAHHPWELFRRPSEAAVVNPANPQVLAAHAGCAAFEKPLAPEDREFLGEEIEELAPDLVASGDLRPRGGLLFWDRREAPAPGIDIRTAGGPPLDIVDERGELIGTVDEGRAFSQAHPGAVYLHQGDGYLVESLDLGARLVRVRREEVPYFTQPHEETWVTVLRVAAAGQVGRFGHCHGEVEVQSHVLGFKRRGLADRTVLGYEPLDLPPRRFTTQALWVTVPDELVADAGIDAKALPGTLHAAEHTSIALLPLFAICDRWDVGGLSTPFHPDAEGPVWFIYDGYPGGAGIAPVAWEAGQRHLRATLEALRACPCASGCPSCVQSPKCGNFNEPLDKRGAIALLTAGLEAEA
ncbi:MAG: DEAD/DEAH box helicase [Acidimicrobiia bacterium]|nr:DEAD/DEAH box helicase [Acidimicrobiia bacterium]